VRRDLGKAACHLAETTGAVPRIQNNPVGDLALMSLWDFPSAVETSSGAFLGLLVASLSLSAERKPFGLGLSHSRELGWKSVGFAVITVLSLAV